MKHIPNIITSLNLTSGFIAIIFAANGHLVEGSWLILAAMILDFFDGFIARLLRADTGIGKELDSLADVVSFGVAPGLIIFCLLNKSIFQNGQVDFQYESLKSILLLLIAALMPVCGAIRLAVFNLDSTQSTTFRGLPIPANALAVISIVLAAHFSQSPTLGSFMNSPILLVLFTVILSLLMVSRIPLLSLKVTSLKLKGNEGRYLLVILILFDFVFFGPLAIPLIIPLYIVSSAVSLLF